MSDDSNYSQCRLRRGPTEQIAWIPSRFAVLDKYLRISDVDGWRVVGVGAQMPDDYVLTHQRDYRSAFASLD